MKMANVEMGRNDCVHSGETEQGVQLNSYRFGCTPFLVLLAGRYFVVAGRQKVGSYRMSFNKNLLV